MIGWLLCGLKRHAPAPDGLWNGGYCFTHCRRCGRDMVRSAFGEWHVPRDHRVVWRAPGDGRGHDVAPVDPGIEADAIADPAPPPPVHRPVAAPAPRRGERRDPFDFGEFDDHPAEDAPPRASPNRHAAR